MPWVKFHADFDWKMSPRVLTAYKAGMRCLVSQDCADAAIADGKGIEDVAEEAQSRRRSRRAPDASR